MPLLLICKIDTVATTSRGFAPLLHGGQPGLDDWFPVLAFALGLLLFVGFAIYNVKKQPPATPDEPVREHNR
jgi:hypothetical protein